MLGTPSLSASRRPFTLGGALLALTLLLLSAAPGLAEVSPEYYGHETGPNGERFSGGSPTCGPPCATMGARQEGSGGYAIEALLGGLPITEYVPGDVMQIDLGGGIDYKGYIITSEVSPGMRVGDFVTIPADGQHVAACVIDPEASVTHTSARVAVPRNSDSFLWLAPASDVGPITFTAHVVVSFGNWFGLNAAGEDQITLTLNAAQPTGVASDPVAGKTRLLASRPNPFVNSTRINFELAEASPVRLEVLDVSGRLVRKLEQGSRSAGRHFISWDGRSDTGASAVAGVYFIRLLAGRSEFTQKVTVLGRR